MASKLTGADVARIGIQEEIVSPDVDSTLQNLKNKVNEIIDELAALSIGTTNAETTDARPYHTNLKERLDSIWSGQYSYVKSGGVVTLNAIDFQKFDVSAGEAKVNGIDVKWSGATTGTIAYTSTNTRFDVIVINSDSTLSVVTGTESADPVYPTISSTQKPLSLLGVSTGSISSTDCRDWGAYYRQGGQLKWKWKAQDAIDDTTSQEAIITLRGVFYEELDFSSITNMTIYGDQADVYRISSTNYGVKLNGSSRIKIEGLRVVGNSKGGSLPNYYCTNSDGFILSNCKSNGNSASSATGKDIEIDNCVDYYLNNMYYPYSTISKNITSSTGGTVISDNSIKLRAEGKTGVTIDEDNNGTDTGITIGGDTNLYRDSANVLKTDDQFDCATLVCNGLADIDGVEIQNSKITSPKSTFHVAMRYTVPGPIDRGDIYDAMSPYLPNVNDQMIVSGGAYNTATGEGDIYSYAVRTNSSTIVIWGCRTIPTGSSSDPSGITISSGLSTPFYGSIAW